MINHFSKNQLFGSPGASTAVGAEQYFSVHFLLHDLSPKKAMAPSWKPPPFFAGKNYQLLNPAGFNKVIYFFLLTSI
jgi:hypothetical protein